VPHKQYRIKVGETGFHGGDDELKPERIVVHTHVDLVGQVELTLTAAAHDAWQSFAVGAPLHVRVPMHGEADFDADRGETAWGPSTNGDTFHGVITGLRYSLSERNQPRLTVLAHDAQHFLRSTRTTRSWVGEGASGTVNDLQAVEAVLSEARGDARIYEGHTSDQTPVERPHVFQRAESDLAFLRRLAARNGHLLLARPSTDPGSFRYGVVDFTRPGFAQQSDAIVIRHRPHVEQLDFTITPRATPATLGVRGRDPQQRGSVELASATIERVYGDLASDQAMWYGTSSLDAVQVSEEAARTLVEAELERLARGVVRGRAVLTTGYLWPTTTIRFEGHRLEEFDIGAWVVGCRYEVSSLYPGGRTEIAFGANAQASAGS